jgi:hypothetical protein
MHHAKHLRQSSGLRRTFAERRQVTVMLVGAGLVSSPSLCATKTRSCASISVQMRRSPCRGVYEYLEAGGALGVGFTVRDGDYYRHGAGDAHRFAAELAAMIG